MNGPRVEAAALLRRAADALGRGPLARYGGIETLRPGAAPAAARPLTRAWVIGGTIVAVAIGFVVRELLFAGGAATPAATPAATSGPSDAGTALGFGAAGAGPDVVGLVIKALLVLGLLYLTLRVLRRMQGTAGSGTYIKVLETKAIAAKASIHLVAIGDRRLLVGLTAGGMVALAELDSAEVDGAATPRPAPGRFADAIEIETAAASVSAPAAVAPQGSR